MQRFQAEGLLLLAPELASGAEGFREGVVGQIHCQVMAHAQVRNHRLEDLLGFPLEALPIGHSGFTSPADIAIPLARTGVFEPEGAVVRAGGLKQRINTGGESPLA